MLLLVHQLVLLVNVLRQGRDCKVQGGKEEEARGGGRQEEGRGYAPLPAPPPAPPLPSPKISARTASFRFPSLVALWALVSMASHHCPFPGEGLLEGEGRGGTVEACLRKKSSERLASHELVSKLRTQSAPFLYRIGGR